MRICPVTLNASSFSFIAFSSILIPLAIATPVASASCKVAPFTTLVIAECFSGFSSGISSSTTSGNSSATSIPFCFNSLATS